MTIDDLQSNIDSGKTTIIAIQAWPEKHIKNWKSTWKEGHYAIVVGMDNANVYLMDPSTHESYTFIPIKELPERWHDIDNKVRTYGIGITVSGDNPPHEFPEPPKRLL